MLVFKFIGLLVFLEQFEEVFDVEGYVVGNGVSSDEDEIFGIDSDGEFGDEWNGFVDQGIEQC